MVSTISKSQILNIYKSLLRESKRIPTYNFRMYALRKVRHCFKENKELTDPELIVKKVEEAKQNLEIVKRQASIGQMYLTDKLVIERIRIR